VRNPLRIGSALDVPGSGLGLVGLAERTALLGGRLQHGVTPDHQFTLTVWLPWPA
jgi:signal transduction histidine kinase